MCNINVDAKRTINPRSNSLTSITTDTKSMRMGKVPTYQRDDSIFTTRLTPSVARRRTCWYLSCVPMFPCTFGKGSKLIVMHLGFLDGDKINFLFFLRQRGPGWGSTSPQRKRNTRNQFANATKLPLGLIYVKIGTWHMRDRCLVGNQQISLHLVLQISFTCSMVVPQALAIRLGFSFPFFKRDCHKRRFAEQKYWGADCLQTVTFEGIHSARIPACLSIQSTALFSVSFGSGFLLALIWMTVFYAHLPNSNGQRPMRRSETHS